jgi:hypothetical protein
MPACASAARRPRLSPPVASTTTSRRPLPTSQRTSRAMPRRSRLKRARSPLGSRCTSSQLSLMSTPTKPSTCPRLFLMTILACGLAASSTVRLEWQKQTGAELTRGLPGPRNLRHPARRLVPGSCRDRAISSQQSPASTEQVERYEERGMVGTTEKNRSTIPIQSKAARLAMRSGDRAIRASAPRVTVVRTMAARIQRAADRGMMNTE